MPRKKSELKPLTEKRILDANPERATFTDSKQTFKEILKTPPFDKKSK